MASVTGRKKKRNEGRLGIFGICAVVIAFGVIMFIKTKDAKETAEDLSKKQQQLEVQLKEEEERAEELEERKIYVQTKKYVEEVAKSLGLVYPDELIYRPSKDSQN